MTPRPIITRFSEAIAVWTPKVLNRLLLTGAQNDNAFSLLHRITYSGRPTTNSYVCEQDVAFYVLKGQFTCNVWSYLRNGEKQRFDAQTGDFVSIPRLTSFKLEFGDKPVEYIQFGTPAGFDMLATAEGSPARSLGPPPDDLPTPTPEQRKIFLEIYGLHRVKEPDDSPSTAKDTKEGASIASAPIAYITNAQKAPAYWVSPAMPELWTFYAMGSQNDNQYGATEIFFAQKGHACRPISYQRIAETYYLLSGKITYLLGDRIVTAEAGDAVYIAPETVFAIRIDSDEGARALVFHTPPGVMEWSMRHMATVPAKDRTTPPQDFPKTDVHMDMMMLSMKQAGLKYVAVADPLREQESRI